MYNSKVPEKQQLPSSLQLAKSSIIALVVALVVLVTVVLPAEFGIDPTGSGQVLGLTQMGEIKIQLAQEAEADRLADIDRSISVKPNQLNEPTLPTVVTTPSAPRDNSEAQGVSVPAEEAKLGWQDEIRIVLTPGQGTEYKLTMNDGAVAEYHWLTEGGPINFDAHGNGSGKSISYEKGRGIAEDEGFLKAAFDGEHGWFFRNRNENNVVLILKTRGDYGLLKKVI